MNKSSFGRTIFTVLMITMPCALSAQRPDLSGRWTVDTEASKMSAQAKSAGEIVKITQTADAVTVEMGANTKPITMMIKLDGTETTSEFPNGTVKTRGKWEGDKLVVHNTRAGKDGEMTETTASWFLRNGALVMQNDKGNAVVYKRVN